MKSKEFIQAIENGKTVFRTVESMPCLTVTKHPKGTYVYMDVAHGIFVTFDRISAETDEEILGWVADVPSVTIKTGEWFA